MAKAPGKHLYDVTISIGQHELVRADRFEVTDGVVMFRAKKAGKGGVACFSVEHLGSVVRVDFRSRVLALAD